MKQKNKKEEFLVCYYIKCQFVKNLLTGIGAIAKNHIRGTTRAGESTIRAGEDPIRAGEDF